MQNEILDQKGVIIGTTNEDELPQLMAELYGMPLAAAEEHNRACNEAIAAGLDIDLGSGWQCHCSHCHEARAAQV